MKGAMAENYSFEMRLPCLLNPCIYLIIFIEIFSQIERVNLFKHQRFLYMGKDVAVRISNSQVKSSMGRVRITAGTMCGNLMKWSYAKWSNHFCRPALSGRYVIVQSLGPSFLALGEVSIFIHGMCYP